MIDTGAARNLIKLLEMGELNKTKTQNISI